MDPINQNKTLYYCLAVSYNEKYKFSHYCTDLQSFAEVMRQKAEKLFYSTFWHAHIYAEDGAMLTDMFAYRFDLPAYIVCKAPIEIFGPFDGSNWQIDFNVNRITTEMEKEFAL